MNSKLLIAAFAAAVLIGCSEPPTPPAEPVEPVEPAAPAEPITQDSFESSIGSILAAAHRTPENVARDGHRHPAQTLAFFGIGPEMTVVEVTPGGGWYAEILVPLLREQGRYIGMIYDPQAVESERAREYYTKSNAGLREKFAAHPQVYDRAELVEIDPAAPKIAEAGSADLVLTFRNVHNWINSGDAPALFAAFHAVLKPGGVLGVVEHRAAPDTPYSRESGYVTEAEVIALAQGAGFELAAQSEINANPADTKDHEAGVWTLPPTLRLGEQDREKYVAIGESDRMTLKFVKPAAGDTAEAPADADEPQ
ncbi:MAG TPA: methyltransferase [Xanthomonadaceae bacterium]|nr:methyltransferase [Xanthomonadaceae bacterium]